MKVNFQVIGTIFKRNFASYFASPTGYVFICAFVLISGFAAFWPHEFFNANLANLEQLNKVMPLILLGFIPAITMSLWADERRQGTDELLLTLPASDMEVVAGKYLAAVAIFSVSLAFSMTNLIVLSLLGDPDWGLALSTYFGYWMLGITMLSIGMVASFLTDNLTVGFVLGVAFNAPLIFAYSADMIVPDPETTQLIRNWSFQAVFRDFTRGVISSSSMVYLLALTAAMSYLCMVLIGRRHWQGGEQTGARTTHYIVRVVSLIVLALGLTLLFRTHDVVRLDASSEKLSSISDQTRELLGKLDDETKVKIEAYISPEAAVPESYIPTRIDLLTMLDELQKRSGGKIDVTIHETESHKAEATIAEQTYGIRAERKFTKVRGRLSDKEFFMGVAIMSGLKKDVIGFFDRGLPAEYELVRSIVSLTDQKKKTLGIVTTDFPADDRGGYGALRAELEKQYEVKTIAPASPIEKVDVLLVVQPSTLDTMGLRHVMAAIRNGTPTAIFEDTRPNFSRVGGTSEPRQPQQNPFNRFQPPQGNREKGPLPELWNLIGVDFDPINIVWQGYNPSKYDFFPKEFVFVAPGSGQENAFSSESEITSGLQQMLLVCPGGFDRAETSKLTFTPLLKTGRQTGLIVASDFMRSQNPDPHRIDTGKEYVLAAHIRGKKKVTVPEALPHGHPPLKKDDEKKNEQEADINVVLVSDTDLLTPVFFNMRAEGQDPDMDRIYLDVDNVTFVMNVIDELAGDDRFIAIRKRRRAHRTLTAFEKKVEKAEKENKAQMDAYVDQTKKAIEKAQEDLNEAVKKIQKTPGIDQREFDIQVNAARSRLQKELEVKQRRLEEERDEKIKQSKNELELGIRTMQSTVKRLAVFIPPLIPLIIGVGLFFQRRGRELEGAVKSRIRNG